MLRGLDRDDFLAAVTGHGDAHEVAEAGGRPLDGAALTAG